MFLEGISELKQLVIKLETQFLICTKQKDRFKEMYLKMKQVNSQ